MSEFFSSEMSVLVQLDSMQGQHGISAYVWFDAANRAAAHIRGQATRIEALEDELAVQASSAKRWYETSAELNRKLHPAPLEVAAAELRSKALRIRLLEGELSLSHQDKSFYKCCALSGEVPLEGSEPSAKAAQENER